MLVLIFLQNPLNAPLIEIKELIKNTWIYQKNYQNQSIEWTYNPSANERVFGSSQYFRGNCNSATTEKAILREVCDFYYLSDIIEFSESTLTLYAKGSGKFRISINSYKGYITKEVELNDTWQEISFDMTKAIPITQHGNKLRTNLKVSFTPLSKNFEIYISKFILK